MLTIEDNTQAAVTDEMLDDYFAQALARHQAEDWSIAEDFYRKVLAVIPEQANVNYNLGMLKVQLNQINLSLDFFKKALAVDDTQPKYWLAYVEALAQEGQKKQAVDVLMKGIEQGLQGEDVDALVNELISSSATRPVIPVNNAQQAISIVGAAQYQPVPRAVKPEKVETQADNSLLLKSMQPYLNNPQVNKLLTLQQSGKLTEAKKLGTKLLKLLPKHPVVLTCLGGIAVADEQYDKGISLFEQSLKIVPEQAIVLSYLSIAYLKQDKFKEAIRSINQAIKLNPVYAEAHANKGNILRAQARYNDALKSYQQALALKPDDADTKYNLALVYADLKEHQQAVKYFKQVITLASKDLNGLHLYADALLLTKAYKEAVKFFNAAIARGASAISIWLGRGTAYLHLDEHALARDDFFHVIKSEPMNGNAQNNLGVVQRELERYEEALAAYDVAIEVGNTLAKTLSNKAILLVDMHRFDEALACYEQSMEAEPDYYENYWSKSLYHLVKGDFTQGWPLYEYRWKSIIIDAARSFSVPLWLGNESIAGKTIFIYPEQGHGDYIQMCRYVTEVEKLGANVILEVAAPLLPLMQSLKGNISLVESGSSLPDFDYQCPVMSLPLAFKTQQETIPASIPYLYADTDKTEHWNKRLGEQTKPRVGLVWSGSTVHKHDHRRSIKLETLKPILSLPFEFHSLQKEFREHDIRTLADVNVIQTHADDLNSFADTAALISQMDLVITVDTSVAHLAGAMGKECWVMLPYSPDWRWLLDREDSPWYPSVTLFRQQKAMDWSSVLDALQLKLNERLK